MPISIVVGGQYGSEGKGKVALELVRRDPSTTMVVRPGGTNSGHTGYDRKGRRFVLRQIPAAAIDGNVTVVFPPGSYIDVELLLREMREVGLDQSQVIVDPRAQVIRPEHIQWESEAHLTETIGSTNSGTGAAVISRISRYAPQHPYGLSASEDNQLQPFLRETLTVVGSRLSAGERVLIEGTQGYGLSLLHGDCWPKCTSRDTTAAGLLSEAGFSPLHVDRIVLVLRCHPIRVAGDSGPLSNESSWDAIAQASGAPDQLTEFTSVTRKVRRVGSFDADIVKRAIAANHPTDIVLNHMDYIDYAVRLEGKLTEKARAFLAEVESALNRRIDFIGTSYDSLVENRLDQKAF